MNDKFENQKEQLLSIKHEISLLHQQVNYLLRNEKPIELLDLDVLMNRTHTVYDLLCSINIGENMDDEDLGIAPEAFSSLFGVAQGAENEAKEEPEASEEPAESTVAFMEPVEEVPTMLPEEVLQEAVEEEVIKAPEPSILAEQVQEEIPPQPVEEVKVAPEPEPEDKPLGDEFGFFFRFEDVPEQEETKQEQPGETENKVVHFVEEIPEEEIPERDLVDGESLVKDNPLEMPKMEHEVHEEDIFALPDMKPEEIVHSEPSEYEDVFKRDDTEFEMATTETLGERMMQEDHSLAAKLQQDSVRDLRSVIGINDKFLFVNELFGGSMEKFNKSIDNLNDLKTLNGAMIYLNELKIELQWNSSNEAYQKLKELVTLKFE